MPKNRQMQNIIGTEHITDSSEAAIAAQAGSGNVVDDTTPQLGGNLDVNGNAVVSTANGNIELNPNGTGVVIFKGNATKGAGQFKLNCEQNSHGIVIKGPPHSAGASYTLTLPDTDGSANQVLKTDGSGNLDWVAQSGGGGGAISSMADLQPKPQSSNLESVGGAGNYQKTLGGAPFFLNLGSWSTIQTGDMSSGNDGQVVFFPYMGSGETMVKAKAYKVNSSGQNNDMKLMLAFYASDSDGIPTGSPVNGGSVELISLVSAGASIIESTWTNGPTLTSGELFYLGVTIDTNAAVAAASGDRNLGSIRATPTFEQEALGFSFNTLLVNNSQFGRVTGLKSTTSTGSTNGSRAFPTIGSGSVSLATTSGKNVPRVSFEVTYS